MTLHIVRATSWAMRWHVCGSDGLLRKYDRKRTAEYHLRMHAGDLSCAPAWYRDLLAHYMRTNLRLEQARRSAMWSAKQFGLGPDQVKADPKTGEPRDDAEGPWHKPLRPTDPGRRQKPAPKADEVYALLLARPGITAREIANATGRSVATVTGSLIYMRQQGIARHEAGPTTSAGTPPHRWWAVERTEP